MPLVRIPFPQDDGTLTPYTFDLGYPLVTLLYDTLLWRDPDGVPRPWLARSVDTSPDGRRLTIRLVEGARWHDGAPVTADDVTFTFGFMASHPHPRFTPQLASVERSVAADPSTVVVDLREPSPGFVDQPLADLPILPAHLWRSLGGRAVPAGPPVGSGPYRLTEHRPGQSYRLEANDDYFKGRPTVRTIEVPIIGDAERTVQALRRQEVDMVPVPLPPALAGDVEAAARSLRGPTYLGTVLLLNTREPPLDRPEVRRAVGRALDLRRVAGAVGGLPAGRGLLHPESPWAPARELHVFDEDGARTTLAGAGLGKVEVLAADNDPVRSGAARQVASALKRAGVAAEARLVPRSELGRAVGEDGSPPSFRLAVWSSPPLASYDPDFLRRLFGSPPTDGSLNYSGYTSAAFDELARTVAVTRDQTERRAAVGRLLALLAEDAPTVPLFFADGEYAYRPAAYDGWVFVKGTGILDKQSFLPRPQPAPDRTPVARPTGSTGDADGSSVLGRLAATAGALAGVMAVVAVVRSRRHRAP